MTSEHRVLHITFVVSLIILLLTNLTVLVTIFDEWNSDGPYSHGFLGIIVVCYVFYLQRKKLHIKSLSITEYLFGFCCLAISLCVALIAQLSSIQQLQQLALFSSLLSLMFCFYGWGFIKAFFTPLLLLFLIMPVWSLMQLPLRELSTAAGQWGPELIGIAVDRDQYRLSTAGGMFDVEPACSGLGFFLVAALLAFCVGYFNKLSTKRTLTFLAICLAISIVANWLRIIIIIVVGTFTEMQHFIVQDHLTFGWIVFAICLIPLIYIARVYFDDSQKSNDTQESVDSEQVSTTTEFNKTQSIATFALLALFVTAFYWIPSRFNENYAFTVPTLSNYEMAGESRSYSPNWKPYSQGASKERFFYYVKENVGFQVYLADYVKQEQASEMIFVENYLYDDQFWHDVEDKKLPLLDNQYLQQANLVVVQRSQARYRMIASWYVINGVITSDKKRAKLAEVQAALVGEPGATLVAVALDYDGQNSALAEQTLSEFIHSYLNP